MKYGSFKTATPKTLSIPVPNGGIDISCPSDSISDRCISYAENIWYKDGRLKTRPALSCDEYSVISPAVSGSAGRYSYTLTESVISLNGKQYRVATADSYYDLSTRIVSVYLVGERNDIISLGFLRFGRVDDTTFYVPENITFFSGKPQNGGGIFAFVKLVNEGNYNMTDHRIYEINSSMDSWELSASFYIPTVYINGRGNAYAAAKAVNSAFLAAPTELEAPNLLNGSFYAYYSSDGYSHSFRLPYTNLSNSTVICRINESLEAYTEWIIYEGESSATNSFLGNEVTAHVDREKGTVYFTVKAGAYAVPKMDVYSENNIRILAIKDDYLSFEQVVSAKQAIALGDRTVFSSGNRLYYCKYENPLYFPFNTTGTVGAENAPITAIKTVENKIAVFKEAEIYTVSLKKGRSLNVTALLTDNSSVFSKTDEFEVKQLSNSIGCVLPSSVQCDKGCIVLLGTDNRVYSLTPSGNVKCISQKYDDALFLDSSAIRDGCTSVITGKHYILSYSNKSIIIEYNEAGLNGNNEHIAFYLWSFPEHVQICGSLFRNGVITLLCHNTNENLLFAAGLAGNKDKIICRDSVEEHNIDVILRTKEYTLSSKRKKVKLNFIKLAVCALGRLHISLDNGKSYSEHCMQSSELAAVKEHNLSLLAGLPSTEKVGIEIKTSKDFSLGNINIYYTE